MMKKQITVILLLIIIPAILIESCSKTSEDRQTVTPPPVTTCDTVGMKYSTDIVAILESHCYSCHGNGNTGGSGGIDLDGYSSLKPYVDNGQIKGNITHASGFVGMPYGQPKMDDCTINKILDWINQGAQNN